MEEFLTMKVIEDKSRKFKKYYIGLLSVDDIFYPLSGEAFLSIFNGPDNIPTKVNKDDLLAVYNYLEGDNLVTQSPLSLVDLVEAYQSKFKLHGIKIPNKSLVESDNL